MKRSCAHLSPPAFSIASHAGQTARRSWRLQLFWLMGCLLASPLTGQDDGAVLDEAVQRAIAAVEPTVVRLDGSWADNDRSTTAGVVATGLIIDADGWVLTAAVGFDPAPASLVATTASGQRYPANLVATDFVHGLSLLRLEGARGLPTCRSAAAPQRRVGQTVIAVGRGLDGSSVQVARGILSANHRIWGKAVQTDARLSPVHYGGPLINLAGEVLGICLPRSATSTELSAGLENYDSGVGFAAPLDGTLERLGDLKLGRAIRPGQLGIRWESEDLNSGPPRIAFCPANSPAGKVGLQPGDTVVELEGVPIRRLADVLQQLGSAAAGDPVSIVVERAGERLSGSPTLVAEIPAFPVAGIGLRVRDVTEDPPGVEVIDVDTSSPATAAIPPGSRLQGIAGRPLKSLSEWRLALAGFPDQPAVEIELNVQGEARRINLPLSRRSANLPKPALSLVPASAVATGSFELAEDGRRCHTWIPEAASELPLLVWLAPAGPQDAQELDRQWSEACRQTGVAVLVIESQSPDAWQRSEASAVMAAINTLVQRIRLDPARLALGGAGGQAELAALTVSRFRREFQGLILGMPETLETAGRLQPSPEAPMLVLIEQADTPTLRPLRVPFATTPTLKASDRLNWVRWLDRL